MKYIKLYEEYTIDRLTKSKLLTDIDAGGRTDIPAVKAIKGDIDKAIDLIDSLYTKTERINHYGAMMEVYPEWRVTQDTLDNREGELEAKMIELALLVKND